jgi:hypothetical protein
LISNTIRDVNGNVVPNVQVVFDLIPPGAFRSSDHSEVASRYTTTTDANGNYSVSVEQNATLNPVGTYYKITEKLPDSAGGYRYWNVLAAGSAVDVMSGLTTPPASPGAMVDYLTKAEGDALYAPISAVNTIAPSNVSLVVRSYSEIIP